MNSGPASDAAKPAGASRGVAASASRPTPRHAASRLPPSATAPMPSPMNAARKVTPRASRRNRAQAGEALEPTPTWAAAAARCQMGTSRCACVDSPAPVSRYSNSIDAQAMACRPYAAGGKARIRPASSSRPSSTDAARPSMRASTLRTADRFRFRFSFRRQPRRPRPGPEPFMCPPLAAAGAVGGFRAWAAAGRPRARRGCTPPRGWYRPRAAPAPTAGAAAAAATSPATGPGR